MATEPVPGGADPASTPPVVDAPQEVAAWEGLEATAEFKDLVRARWKFVIPATVFFLVYYFLLPVLNGVATGFMRTNVMAWLLAFFYIRRANTVFDALASRVRELAGRRVQS